MFKRLVVTVAAAAALAGGGLATAGPASATSYYHCPAGYFCLYAGGAGQGYPTHEFAGNNDNWSPYGAVGADGSALNWGTSGKSVNVYDEWGDFDYCVPWHGHQSDAGNIGGSNFWVGSC